MIDTIEAPAEVAIEPEVARAFSHFDKCDRCGLQAYYIALKDTHELAFCKHHGDEHLPALAKAVWKIFDYTEELIDKDKAR